MRSGMDMIWKMRRHLGTRQRRLPEADQCAHCVKPGATVPIRVQPTRRVLLTTKRCTLADSLLAHQYISLKLVALLVECAKSSMGWHVFPTLVFFTIDLLRASH